MPEGENLKVFQGTPSEDVRLENLGYEQGTMLNSVLQYECLHMQSSSALSV